MADSNDLLLDAYDRIAESVPAVLEGLTTDQAAWQPEPEANSVGWLVWHLTRVIDSHLADATGEAQVHADHEARLGLALPLGDTGYGHSPQEAASVRFEDLGALLEYYAAVQERTARYLAEVGDLDRVVDTRWDPPVTLGMRLVSVVDDAARHIGQAEYVRGLVERRA